jgi:hypothetical protein
MREYIDSVTDKEKEEKAKVIYLHNKSVTYFFSLRLWMFRLQISNPDSAIADGLKIDHSAIEHLLVF